MDEYVSEFVSALPSVKLEDGKRRMEEDVDVSRAESGLLASDVEVVLNSLRALATFLKTHDKEFGEDVYGKVISLAMQDDNVEIAEEACDVLRLMVSFKSGAPMLLMRLGIMDVVQKRFGHKNVWGLVANLCLGGIECRRAIFDSGVLNQVPQVMRSQERVLDACIAGMAQCLVYDVEDDFGIDRYGDVLMPIFLELLEMFRVTTNAHDSIVGAFRDLVECSDMYLDWFIEENILPRLMASDCKDPQFLERMCRLFCVLCELRRCKYVTETGAIQWTERVKLTDSVAAQISMYDFYEAFIDEWGDDMCSDTFWKESTVRDAKQTFQAADTSYKLRKAIAGFLAAVFAHASAEGVFELWKHQIFALLIDNFEMIDFDQLYGVITHLELITRMTDVDPFQVVRDNDDLNEMIERKYTCEDNAMARLLQGIIWYDRDSEYR